MARLDIHSYYLKIAEAVSLRSPCLKKHYGCCLVSKTNRVVATGYNGVPVGESHCEECTKTSASKAIENYMHTCRSVHAEMNCLLSASKDEMLGGTLYLACIDPVTNESLAAEPCDICLRLIKNSGISKVINKNGLLFERNKNGILERV